MFRFNLSDPVWELLFASFLGFGSTGRGGRRLGV